MPNTLRDKIITLQLRDEIFSDYVWYSVCEINDVPSERTPCRTELERQLTTLVNMPPCQHFISQHPIKCSDSYGLNRLIEIIKNEFNEKCLTKEDYIWLNEKDNRTIFYIWRQLEHLISKPLDDNQCYDDFELTFMPASNINNAKQITGMGNIVIEEATKQKIVCLINRLKVSKSDKARINNAIKDDARRVIINKKLVNWFEKYRDTKTEWLCEYLYRKNLGYRSLTLPNLKHLTDDIISFFDVLYSFNEDKSNFIFVTMKKAWDQCKYRENNKEKKQYSINMRNDIGKILDELSRAKGENKNAIVEALIRAEYDEITKTRT